MTKLSASLKKRQKANNKYNPYPIKKSKYYPRQTRGHRIIL